MESTFKSVNRFRETQLREIELVAMMAISFYNISELIYIGFKNCVLSVRLGFKHSTFKYSLRCSKQRVVL